MKKYFSIFFIATLLCCEISAQQIIADIARKYYRSNPFESEFSQFLVHLMNDPTLKDKSIHKRTDSTLFFMEGIYTDHNPFSFKGRETKIILAEKEEAENDSAGSLQITYLYQLVAYALPGEEGIKNIREEFDKFCRHYKRKFDGDNYKELKSAEKQVGEIRDYISGSTGFSPLSVAWATSNEQNNNLIAITIRFRVFDNRAYLPLIQDVF
ncbi:MAG: hypothetical protein JJE22_10120 [Bacteroidia bacterium]|nr:hypothetical protein [Bacteroidia bacterium]